ncbi:homeobox domain-containing protein [Blakeslea trispora]|nr:homeobox domain-containing protein [Blakeslea trispora]
MKDQTEKSNLNKRVETSEFNLNFYNPFEIKHRQRTSRSQLKALEKAFATNPKPNGKLRQILAENLSMSPRGIQVWFQNRRAKAKLQLKSRDKSQDDEPNLSSPELLSATSMVHNRSQSSSTDSSWHSDKSDHMVQSTKFDEPWHNCLAEKVSMGPSSLCSSFMNRNSSVFNLNEGWPMTTVAGKYVSARSSIYVSTICGS